MRGEGKYRRLAAIGHGGMADVYLAAAQGPGDFQKLLVLKELRPGFALDPEHRAMFQQEARLAARMAHPNVVQTFEIGGAEGRPFIAMEFLDGPPLHRLLRRVRRDGGELPLALHLRVLVDLLAGLHHAHELRDYEGYPLGLVHRDVTPHNVIVTHEGQVKLVDFGIARSLDGGDTQVGTFKGKASYCAPEQARGEPLDRRADLFAVGVMLWEALMQRRMWQDLDEPAIVQRLRAGEVPAVPDGPLPGLRALCRRALAHDPAERPASADAFAAAIEAQAVGPRASRRELAALVDALFGAERAELRARIDAQLRRSSREPEADAPVLDVSPGPGSDSHVGGAPAHPDEPTRPDGVVARERPTAPTPAALADATESGPGLGAPARRRRRSTRGRAALGLTALTLGACLMAYVLKDRSQGAGPNGQVATGACAGADGPEVELSGEIEGDARLTCDRRWRLSFVTFVRPGATLTIEPGTTIVGDPDSRGALVVQPGARLLAEGTPERPIVFTSAAPPGARRAGDWGGLLLLGRAPTNLRDAAGAPTRGRVEGIASGGEYGGDDPDDSSGALRHVRVEYSGLSLGPNNEINGVTLAGVGRGTALDHVQVRHTADDCFEFFGGTVDGHHLICQDPGDDGFDWDLGYTGRLQFLLLRGGEGGDHGLEGDNDPGGSARTPISAPQIYNATLCGGAGRERPGMLLRHGSRATVGDAIFVGFAAALDLRDRGSALTLRGALGSALAAPFEAEAPAGPLPDDDDGLDERALFAGALRLADPQIPGCLDPGRPELGPPAALTDGAVAPPDDGFFDASAAYLGAVRDRDDAWPTAPWTRWD